MFVDLENKKYMLLRISRNGMCKTCKLIMNKLKYNDVW